VHLFARTFQPQENVMPSPFHSFTAPPAASAGFEPLGAAAALTINAGRRWLQWAAQAQQQQAQSVRDWLDNVSTAAAESARAPRWDSLLSIQAGLVNATLLQALNSQRDWVSSCVALQADLAQQMQEQAVDTIVAAVHRPGDAGSAATPAASSVAPKAVYEQAQASLDAFLKRLTTMAADGPGGGRPGPL
jgi:hypothetical protein